MKVMSELTANVWKIMVSEGDEVSVGDTLLILESMKMEIPVEAPESGTILALRCAEADTVAEGQVLVEIG